MTYLIDSDWVIDYLRGQSAAIEFLGNFNADELAISIITYGEVYEGVLFAPHRRLTDEALNEFLRVTEIVLLSRPIMRAYARIRGELRQSGRRLDDNDLLIAATALEHDFTLVTRNVNHFTRVPGLRLFQQS